MTTDLPLARYSAVNGALASSFVIAELHHLTGHDLWPCALRVAVAAAISSPVVNQRIAKLQQGLV